MNKNSKCRILGGLLLGLALMPVLTAVPANAQDKMMPKKMAPKKMMPRKRMGMSMADKKMMNSMMMKMSARDKYTMTHMSMREKMLAMKMHKMGMMGKM